VLAATASMRNLNKINELSLAFPMRITIGPYRLLVMHAPRSAMAVKRRMYQYDLSQGLVWLHESLEGKALARYFLKVVTFIIHKAAGCQDGCIEEAFTQSIAAGLVAFAQNNPEVWTWLNGLLGKNNGRGADFARIALGASHPQFLVPTAVRIGHHVVRIVRLRHETAVRMSVDGYFGPSTKLIEVYEGLQGPHRAIVVMHEITHAIHNFAGLKNRDTRARFVEAQVDGWIRFAEQNPGAWMWLLATIREQADFEPVLRVA
jgi:hypothetical protein